MVLLVTAPFLQQLLFPKDVRKGYMISLTTAV